MCIADLWLIVCLMSTAPKQVVECERVAHYRTCVAEGLNKACIHGAIRQAERFGYGAFSTVKYVNQECNDRSLPGGG